jgi:hypothetical protein
MCDLNLCKFSMYVWIMCKVCNVFFFTAARVSEPKIVSLSKKIYQVWTNIYPFSFRLGDCLHKTWWFPTRDQNIREIYLSPPLKWMFAKIVKVLKAENTFWSIEGVKYQKIRWKWRLLRENWRKFDDFLELLSLFLHSINLFVQINCYKNIVTSLYNGTSNTLNLQIPNIIRGFAKLTICNLCDEENLYWFNEIRSQTTNKIVKINLQHFVKFNQLPEKGGVRF